MTVIKKTKPRIIVAMSGGVDSSVAAAMLVRAGFDVTGGFIKNWSSSKDPLSGECTWRADRRDAMRVAAALDIPLLTFDFEKQYRERVVAELYRGYEDGETPNPDVLCNEYIKFGLFWDKAKELGFEAMATGHYAQTRLSSLSSPSGHRSGHDRPDRPATLLRGADPEKDQSYFLYRVSQDALAHTLFPIGNLRKTKVRELARKWKLPVAAKPDSQGICFIGKIDLGTFLSAKIKSKSGDIVTPDGKTIGRHDGLHLYTIGQRQRIGVAGSHPWYVAAKDKATNRLVVVERDDHPWLQAKTLEVDDMHWIAGKSPKLPLKARIQARYRTEALPCTISAGSGAGMIQITLRKPLHAAALGQSAVIYRNRECLGGGVIRQIAHL